MKPVIIIAIAFVLLIPFTLSSAFAETVVVDIPEGTGVPGCEERNECYSPADLTIGVGDTVEWINVDTTVHTVTGGSPANGPSGVFDSSLLIAGSSYSHTFNDAGNYDYFCIIHPWMVGSVTLGNNVDVGNSSSFVTQSILQSDKSIYELMKHGEITVNIFGHIENSSRGDKVVITITQPDGTSSGNTLFLTNSGDFELPYILSENIQLGKYIVMASHNGKIIGEISFNIVNQSKPVPEPEPEPPKPLQIELENISISEISELTATIDIAFKISNPNPASVIVQTLDYRLYAAEYSESEQITGGEIGSRPTGMVEFGSNYYVLLGNNSILLKDTINLRNSGNVPELWTSFKENTTTWRVTGDVFYNLGSITSGQENELHFEFSSEGNTPYVEPTPEPESKELGIASFVDLSKDPQHYIDRYNNEESYKEWFDENYSQYSSIYEAVGLEEPDVEPIFELTVEPKVIPEPIVDPEPTPEPETINFDSLSPIDTSIEKGMWIKYNFNVDFNFPASPFMNLRLMELSFLNAAYGLPEESSMQFMEFQLTKIDGLRIEIVDVTKNDCKTQKYLVMTDGSEEFLTNDDFGTRLCQDTGENKNKRIGDSLTLPTNSKIISDATPSGMFDIKVKELDTITINGKKVDVIIANGKETSYDSGGKSEMELELVIHKHSGILLGASVFVKASQGIESGTVNMGFFANDVSEHFVGTPVIPNVGGGCLIATATYGSEMAIEVQQLRELRDNQLLQTESGTAFMTTFNDVYYSFSPIIADYERENPVFKEMVKIAITPMISSLSILNYVDMDSESKVLGYGISLILLNLGMYLGIPAVVIVGIRKRF